MFFIFCHSDLPLPLVQRLGESFYASSFCECVQQKLTLGTAHQGVVYLALKTGVFIGLQLIG